VGIVGVERRRAAALALLGLVAASGALGLRDALRTWPGRQSTFDSFHGEDTVIGRAAARWGHYGEISVHPGLGRSDLTIDTVRRYGLDPETPARPAPGSGPPRAFRIVGRNTIAPDGERVVERVRDPWGREWAVVLAHRVPS